MKIADEILNQLKFDDKGLITAIAQDYQTNEILMLAFMNL
jgi:phosphoribosyl-AMP cyclohydrolase